MHLNHEFVVPVPVKQAWDVLLDVERIAPCLPGAAVESVAGDSFAGRVKVRVGPITVTYRGTAVFVRRDEEGHRVTIRADGREARGGGTAAATVEAVLHDEGERTRVSLDTELAVTGRPAQFGRGVLVEVSNKLLATFAECVAQTLSADQVAPPATANEPADAVDLVEPAAGRSTPDAIDLVEVAGGPVLRRALPAGVVVTVLIVLWQIIRRIRR